MSTREQFLKGAIAAGGAVLIEKGAPYIIKSSEYPKEFETSYKGPPPAVLTPDNMDNDYWAYRGKKAFVSSVRSSGVAEAAGIERIDHPSLRSFYPGDRIIARDVYNMRRITDEPSGLKFLDNTSTRIVREHYGVEAVFDNYGFFDRLQDRKLGHIRINYPHLYEAFRRAFGLCHAVSIWKTRDQMPFREPGSEIEGFPGMVAPSIRELAETRIINFAGPVIVVYYSDDPRDNKEYFFSRMQNNPKDNSSAFVADIPQGQYGSWLSHVSSIEQRRDGRYLIASRGGAPYQEFHESQVRDAFDPADPHDESSQVVPGGMKVVVQGQEYASPYYNARIARFHNFGESLPDKIPLPDQSEDWTLQ